MRRPEGWYNIRMDKFTEKTLGCERKYTGKIISVDLLDIELPDGRKSSRERRAAKKGR